MPSSVENRVVQMTFDNAKFEQKLDDTIKSIDKLEKSLEFEKSKKNLQDFATNVSRFNLGNISTHIEGVSKGFLAMSTVALTALSNITSAALRSGASIVKSLSLDLALQGFHEYETNINSIQTILANTSAKGTGLKDVTAALDNLNTYSDKTIYNFGQMTKNIGTFTAAGVDLDTSTQSIKGIANLAAISGSSAEQASGAMYQLSQAIANGSLKLQDWNSVVNAGLGGEVFQKALFESGKALKTIKDVPMSQTFDQWKAAGNSFRGSLEDGWITGKVLTSTLQGFTGELTDAQLKSIGYTKDQITEIQRLGKLGVDAATKIRTLTQLLSTVKESVGSGWSASFRIIFGDFEEATTLFTNISNALGKLVSKSSDARNELLSGWKELGGRFMLIKGLEALFKNLALIMQPVKDAFREVFPPVTAKRLADMTRNFLKFAEALKPSEKTTKNIKSIFTGLFSVFKIGIEIIKGITGVIRTLIQSFSDNTNILDTAAKIGDFLTKIRTMLVEGGAIKAFFKDFTKFIQDPLPYLKDLGDAIVNFFKELPDKILPWLKQVSDQVLGFFTDLTGFDFGAIGDNVSKIANIPTAGPLADVLDRIQQRFEQLKSVAEGLSNVWDKVSASFDRIKGVLQSVFDYVITWFKELGQKLADEMKPGDFDAAVDAVNVGLIGGIALILKKFLDGGLKLDFGGGLIAKISGAFEQLTGVLQGMEKNLKADALLKIAAAIAILTASLVVLSLIDSAALTKALTAMAIGFGQLVGVMAAMNKMSGSLTGSAGFTAMALGLVLISTSMLIFAAAVTVISKLSWQEIARGLAGITGGLTLMITAVKLLGSSSPMTILAGAAMIEMATALTILGGALKIFATMTWGEIGRGLTVMAAGLLAIGIALSLVPATAPLVGAGFLLVAQALVILGGAMLIFATMDWGQIAKGIVAMTGALVGIGLAVNLMPPTLPLIGAGLILVGIALIAIAKSLEILGSMKGGDIAKGLGAMAAALIILALATTGMSAALPGAVALGIITIALMGLVKVVQAFASLKFGDLMKGLLGMAAVFALLAIAAAVMQPLIPAILALGAAMLVVGAGFALFGLGALAVAKAIEILANTGKAGMDAIFSFLDGLLERLPKIAAGLATFILDTLTTILEGMDPLIRALGVVLGHLLDKLTELLPKLAVFIGTLIDQLVKLIIDKTPLIVEAGIQLVLNLLKGIRDHIQEIVVIAGELIVNLLKGLADKLPDIIDAGYDLLVAYLKGIASQINKLIDMGVDVVIAFIKGVAKNVNKIIDAGGEIIVNFIKGVSKNVKKVVDKGTDVLVDFLSGIGQNTRKIINAMGDLIVDILDAIADAIEKYMPQIRHEGERIAFALIDGMTGGLASKAKAVADSLVGVASGALKKVGRFLGIHSPSKVMFEMGENMLRGLSNAFEQDVSVEQSAIGIAQKTTEAFQKALMAVPSTLENMNQFNPTVTPVLDLSGVQKDSKKISGFFDTANLNLVPVITQAQEISSLNQENVAASAVDGLAVPQTTEIKFEQNISSPTQLSTADIYRQTRNQLVMAKEELKIP